MIGTRHTDRRFSLPTNWAASFAAVVGSLVMCSSAARADCAPPPQAAHVFYVTDREPLNDVQLFSGERGVKADRDAIVSRGILGPNVNPADNRRCSTQAAFLTALRGDFDPKRGRAVLIYIHGYYTTMRHAATDALAIQQGIRFPGPVIVYSWPSKVTSRLTYTNDESNANWSTIHFHSLLAAIIKAYPRIPISFVSHSLGARLAGDGIDFMHYQPCGRTCIGRAVFFAPDIDGDTLREILRGAGLCRGLPPTAPRAAAHITLYVSNRDRALRQSQLLHGHQRAGQSGSEMLLCSGVDTIDVSYYKSADKYRHSYQAEPRIIDDVRAAFAGVSPAAPSRKLLAAKRNAAIYYELR